MNYWCEQALIGGVVHQGVRLEVSDGRFGDVTIGSPPNDATRLRGLTLPPFTNSHSHAFHRVLRGRAFQDSFWSWRREMYETAARLDPDSYYRLARAVYAEMALAGIGTVGEFHYLHHQPSGMPYQEPNAMGEALIAAAGDVGIRMTLLDTCYLHGGLGRDPEGVQVRFADASPAAWVERVAGLEATDLVKVGAALHSVRALELGEMETVAAWSEGNRSPLHAHVSEQSAENEECVAFYGASPIEVIARTGAVTERFTAIHFTQVTASDIEILQEEHGMVCLCPTTERDLADGIGPARRLVDHGVELSLGTDSHAVIDMFEEMRAAEMDERLASGRREQLSPVGLVAAATSGGGRSLGWGQSGLVAGAAADFVTVTLDGVHTAGIDDSVRALVFAARPGDVTDVVVAGRPVVVGGTLPSIPDPAGDLAHEISLLTD